MSTISQESSAPAIAPTASGGAVVARLAPGLVTAVSAILLVLVWEMSVRTGAVRAVVLPPPSAVWAKVAEKWDVLLLHTWATFSETALASLLAIVGGSLVAVAVTQSPLVSRAFLPYILLSQVVPKIALAPLIVVWLGIGAPARLALAFVIAFFPMIVDVAAGLTSVPEDRLRLARLLRASEWQILRFLRIPSAVPYFFTGAKISVTVAIIGIIVSEFIASDRGLGYLIFDSTNRLETSLAIAASIIVAAIGLLLFGVVALAERFLVRWSECD